MIKERNIVVSILLSIITCGIYQLYWWVTITDDVDNVSENPTKRNGVVVILLTLITCGIYGFYYWYQNGKLMEEANQRKGVNGSSNAILYLILSLFGLSIVNYILVQADLNKYATEQAN